MRSCYSVLEVNEVMGTTQGTLTHGQQFEVKSILDDSKPRKIKRGRPAKKESKMTPQTNEVNEQEVQDNEQNEASTDSNIKRIQKTVFDLEKFSNVTLYKDVELPSRPESIQEAQAKVGNDTKALLDLIWEGLKAKVLADSSKDTSGFRLPKPDVDYPLDMKNELGEVYTGTSASKEKKDIINAAVLSMAKMFGYGSDKTAEENQAAKKQAMDIIRANPVMMKSLQG
jgi:hypothetical protein